MATHEDFARKFEVERSSNRTLGLVFAAFFGIFTLSPLLRHHPPRLWAALVAVVFLGIALAVPNVLEPLNRFWTQLGLIIQRIVHPVVMGIMFYLIFTPAAFLIRLFGQDLLRLKYQLDANSYWICRQPLEPGGMARQF
jgi:hypothetical protein